MMFPTTHHPPSAPSAIANGTSSNGQHHHHHPTLIHPTPVHFSNNHPMLNGLDATASATSSSTHPNLLLPTSYAAGLLYSRLYTAAAMAAAAASAFQPPSASAPSLNWLNRNEEGVGIMNEVTNGSINGRLNHLMAQAGAVPTQDMGSLILTAKNSLLQPSDLSSLIPSQVSQIGHLMAGVNNAISSSTKNQNGHAENGHHVEFHQQHCSISNGHQASASSTTNGNHKDHHNGKHHSNGKSSGRRGHVGCGVIRSAGKRDANGERINSHNGNNCSNVHDHLPKSNGQLKLLASADSNGTATSSATSNGNGVESCDAHCELGSSSSSSGTSAPSSSLSASSSHLNSNQSSSLPTPPTPQHSSSIHHDQHHNRHQNGGLENGGSNGVNGNSPSNLHNHQHSNGLHPALDERCNGHGHVVDNEKRRRKDLVRDEAYWERRRKNNDAAKRSRDSRRKKEDEVAMRATLLEQENLQLRYEVERLRGEVCRHRVILFNGKRSSPPSSRQPPQQHQQQQLSIATSTAGQPPSRPQLVQPSPPAMNGATIMELMMGGAATDKGE